MASATLSEIVATNDTLHSQYESVTAIFTGATQGIGLATLKAFAQHIPKPRAFIVGRSRQRFHSELDNLASLNPNGEFIFIEAEVAMIRSIDAVCGQIKQLVSSNAVDILCMSQGYAPLEGRSYTSEGIEEVLALAYYSRVRMTQNLIDAHVLKPTAMVVSVLAGSKEGKLFEDDLALKRNYSLMNLRAQFSTMMTLSHDALAAENVDMSFVHVFPGRVKTGIFQRSINGWLLWVICAYLVEPLMFLGGLSAEESGERTLWMAMSGTFGKGSWSLDYDGAKSKSKWLASYRQNAGIMDRIREHNRHVFETATTGE